MPSQRDPLAEQVAREIARDFKKAYLRSVTGPMLYGEGNFIVYDDNNGEPCIKAVEGWEPTPPSRMRGLVTGE